MFDSQNKADFQLIQTRYFRFFKQKHVYRYKYSEYYQTLLDPKRYHSTISIFNDNLSMAALMAAFFFRTPKFTFFQKKLPLKLPLIWYYWKCIFYNVLNFQLAGFVHITSTYHYNHIWISWCGHDVKPHIMEHHESMHFETDKMVDRDMGS